MLYGKVVLVTGANGGLGSAVTQAFLDAGALVVGTSRFINARRVQLDLFYDYRKNVDLYPKWQSFLKTQQPKTILFWGQDNVFFTPPGGVAYLQDLPNAEMHRLAAGHFAFEDSCIKSRMECIDSTGIG